MPDNEKPTPDQLRIKSLEDTVKGLKAQLKQFTRVKAGVEMIPLDEHTKETRLEMAVRYLAGEMHRISEVDRILGESEAPRERPVGAAAD